MKYWLSSLAFFLSFSYTFAYNPIFAEPAEQYSIITIEGDPYIERTYLGDLEDAPDLYELKTDVAISLRLQVEQRDSKRAVPFGLIIVKQNEADGGVEEIVRQNEPLDTWSVRKSYTLGMRFLSAPVLEKEIKPGTYRIEVSTPDNKGAYALTVGEEKDSAGLFSALLNVFKTQHHFGFTPFHAIFSLYIFGILVLLGLGYAFYWLKLRKKHTHEFAD